MYTHTYSVAIAFLRLILTSIANAVQTLRRGQTSAINYLTRNDTYANNIDQKKGLNTKKSLTNQALLDTSRIPLRL